MNDDPVSPDKSVTIAVTGSIAAYKVCDLIRKLQLQEIPVRIIMSAAAQKFVGPLTFEALSGFPVKIDNFEGMAHVDTRDQTAVFAVVPATANIIGKMANGIADDLISSTYLMLRCPIMIAPAMNPNMFESKPVQRNLQTLRNDGVSILETQSGLAVCGDAGFGKLAEVDEIAEVLANQYFLEIGDSRVV